MNAICLIDTSIFDEILNVPYKANYHLQIVTELETKIKSGELLFLPMATILETGNHIAQNGNGEQRRMCAKRFVVEVQKALGGESPFSPINFLKKEQMQQWLHEFPDSAIRGVGLGDLSIIHDYQQVCQQNQGRKVYIWSLDKHLSTFCRHALI